MEVGAPAAASGSSSESEGYVVSLADRERGGNVAYHWQEIASASELDRSRQRRYVGEWIEVDGARVPHGAGRLYYP